MFICNFFRILIVGVVILRKIKFVFKHNACFVGVEISKSTLIAFVKKKIIILFFSFPNFMRGIVNYLSPKLALSDNNFLLHSCFAIRHYHALPVTGAIFMF